MDFFNSIWVASIPRTGSMWTANVVKEIFTKSNFNTYPKQTIHSDIETINFFYKNALHDQNNINRYVFKVHVKLNSDLDYNKFLYTEFQDLDLDNLNLDDLHNKVKEADNVDQIKDILSKIDTELNADEIGISDKLSQIVKSLSKVSNSSNRLNELSMNLNLVNENLNQIVNDSELILNDISNSDENIDSLRDTLDKVFSLQNKHKVDSLNDLLID